MGKRMTASWVLALGVMALGMAAGAGPVGADGGGGSGASRPGRAEDPDYTAAVAAVKAGQYASAIPKLRAVVARDDKNADAYNWLAYAIRKDGDPAASIPIYEKALALDPKHRGAHEYIGEAYLSLGDLAKAKRHLAALDSLCFFPCSEYRDLKKAIEAYEKRGQR